MSDCSNVDACERLDTSDQPMDRWQLSNIHAPLGGGAERAPCTREVVEHPDPQVLAERDNRGASAWLSPTAVRPDYHGAKNTWAGPWSS